MHSLYNIFSRRPPNHLQEIRFIDCNLTGTQICLLMDSLSVSVSRLRTLGLVNNMQTDKSFEKTIHFLAESTYIRHVDLSWTQMPPRQWLKFIDTVKDHTSLRFLNLSYNRLLEDQPKRLTP